MRGTSAIDETKYICFQIKSNNDLKDKDCLMKLKAQAIDMKMKYETNLGESIPEV